MMSSEKHSVKDTYLMLPCSLFPICQSFNQVYLDDKECRDKSTCWSGATVVPLCVVFSHTSYVCRLCDGECFYFSLFLSLFLFLFLLLFPFLFVMANTTNHILTCLFFPHSYFFILTFLYPLSCFPLSLQ